MENIDFYADLYGVFHLERLPRIERLLNFSNLTPFRDRLAGKLSGGMKQKLGLACALIHKPEVLFLDEPTCGVDPVSRRDFWKILYDLLKEEITIFLSTAYLDEAERCTRIALVHKGRVLITDGPARIKKTLEVLMVEVSTPRSREAQDIISSIKGVQSVNLYGERLHIAVERRDTIDIVVQNLNARGIEVHGQREIVPSLEDVFIAMVREQ
jgi:ABC-2 type transport system ATP-binding protein